MRGWGCLVSLPSCFFKQFPLLINNLLCRLQDNVNIMAWICQWDCWGPVLSSNMADFFRFLTFPQYFLFLLENFKSYSENALFNSLVCKRCFIMLLYKHFWLTIWPWKLTILHFIKFKILPHTLLVIQFHLHQWSDFHQLKIYIYVSKINK